MSALWALGNNRRKIHFYLLARRSAKMVLSVASAIATHKGETTVNGKRRRIAARIAIFAGLSAVLSPAIGRVEAVLGSRPGPVSLASLGSIGSFTPVTTDERLARRYAQAVTTARSQGFRFTPTVGSMSGHRSITIVVRAPDLGLISGARAPASAIGLGPVAYNLGPARGLNRFATEVSALRDAVPLVSASALAMPRSFSLESRKRLSTKVELENMVQGEALPQVMGDKSFAVDVGSSYALTRNLDVTAGVRYRGRQNRLGPLTDDAQDSQAVYLGTTFKF
jgi:hypothetical protein